MRLLSFYNLRVRNILKRFSDKSMLTFMYFAMISIAFPSDVKDQFKRPFSNSSPDKLECTGYFI